jgi:uncharacterized C2H2 Zn-finger protein
MEQDLQPHFCQTCGKKGPFRSPRALKCINCDRETVQQRKNYHRNYNKAKVIAMARLKDAHRDEYNEYLLEERERLFREQQQKRRKVG